MPLPDRAPALRILHCPRNIGGHSGALSRAESGLGADSRLVLMEAERYGFSADEILTRKGDSALSRWRAKLGLLQRAVRDFDVIHYGGGQPLFTPPPPWFWGEMTGPLHSRLAHAGLEALSHVTPFADLRLLRRKGKVIAVTFQGDDARLGAAQRQRYARSLASEADAAHYAPAGDRWKQRRIAAVDRHAHLIYALNPDLLHDLPPRARYLPYAIEIASLHTGATGSANAVPVIVHAPSDQRVKGTAHVLAAVEHLRNAGARFDFALLENLENADARAAYAKADIIIDQLNAGFYGMLAVEAMAAGKAVVAFMREADLHFLDPAMRRACPVVSAEPDTLAHVLESLLEAGPGHLADLGRAGRAFTARWHDARAVAGSLLRDYEAALGES